MLKGALTVKRGNSTSILVSRGSSLPSAERRNTHQPQARRGPRLSEGDAERMDQKRRYIQGDKIRG